MKTLGEFLRQHSIATVYIFLGILAGVCVVQQLALDQARSDNMEMKATLTKIGTTLDGIAATLNALGEHRLGASAEKAAEEAK